MKVPEKEIKIDNLTMSELKERGLTHLVDELGRPKRRRRVVKKVIDRRNQFSLTYWYGLIAEDYAKLSRIQRVKVALDCWKTLINKANTLPSDPEESKMNVDEAMRMLGKLEQPAQKPILEPVGVPK